jgi:hypothetical protein
MSAVTTVENGNGALMSFIERASRDTEFDVQKFGELLKLQRDIEHDRARRAFNASMAEAQSEMLPVVRDAKNSHLGNRYAKLETIDAAMRPIYTHHGFSVRYGSAPAPGEGMIRITCTVAHSAGYFEESYLDSPISAAGSQGGRSATTPVQAIGSAITYLRRYLLSMCFNVVMSDEDDDGEAMRRTPAAAAAGMARMQKLAPTYEERPPAVKSPPAKTDEKWRDYLAKLRTACTTTTSRAEVEAIGSRPSVADAAENGPEWVQDEVRDILADAYAKWDATDSSDWPGPDPEKATA